MHLVQQLGYALRLVHDDGVAVWLNGQRVFERLAGYYFPLSVGATIAYAGLVILANWAAELERFAPSLKALIAHPSFQAKTVADVIAIAVTIS